jgi:hypothetical protein
MLTLEVIHRSLENTVDLGEQNDASALGALRLMREAGDLTPTQLKQLSNLEEFVAEGAAHIDHTLRHCLECGHAPINHSTLTEGLKHHHRSTHERLAEELDPENAPELKRKLAGSEAESFSALSTISSLVLNSPVSHVIILADALTQDPKHSVVRRYFEAAVDFLGKIKEYAQRLFKDIARKEHAHKPSSIFEIHELDVSTEKERSNRIEDQVERLSDDIVKKAPVEVAGQTDIRATSVERTIAELRKRLSDLTSEINSGYRATSSGSPGEHYQELVRLHQSEAAAASLKAQITDLERTGDPH